MLQKSHQGNIPLIWGFPSWRGSFPGFYFVTQTGFHLFAEHTTVPQNKGARTALTLGQGEGSAILSEFIVGSNYQKGGCPEFGSKLLLAVLSNGTGGRGRN